MARTGCDGPTGQVGGHKKEPELFYPPRFMNSPDPTGLDDYGPEGGSTAAIETAHNNREAT
jgi:hypothetical protein